MLKNYLYLPVTFESTSWIFFNKKINESCGSSDVFQGIWQRFPSFLSGKTWSG